MQPVVVISKANTYKKWAIRIFLILAALALISWGGNSGWKAYKKHLDDLEDEKLEEIADIEDAFQVKADSLINLKNRYITERDSIKLLKRPIISYWNKLKEKEYENEQLRQLIEDIATGKRKFTQRELDSFANHARFIHR